MSANMAFNNSTPLAAAKSFLAAIKTKDVTTMRKLSHPKGTACLIRNGTPTHMSIYEPIDSIGAAESDLDEVSYNEVEHVDGIYATVWTPYRFFEDGKVCVMVRGWRLKLIDHAAPPYWI